MDEEFPIFASLKQIKERIRSKPDIGTIKTLLGEASTILLSPTSYNNYNNIWDQAYGQFITFLLDNVYVDWVSAFTSKEKETLFDVFIIKSPSVTSSFLSLTSYIFSTEQPKDPIDHGYTLEYIEDIIANYFVVQNYTGNMIKEGITRDIKTNNGSTSVVKLDVRWEQIVTIVGSLPDRFSNKLQGKVTKEALFHEYPT